MINRLLFRVEILRLVVVTPLSLYLGSDFLRLLVFLRAAVGVGGSWGVREKIIRLSCGRNLQFEEL